MSIGKAGSLILHLYQRKAVMKDSRYPARSLSLEVVPSLFSPELLILPIGSLFSLWFSPRVFVEFFDCQERRVTEPVLELERTRHKEQRGNTTNPATTESKQDGQGSTWNEWKAATSCRSNEGKRKLSRIRLPGVDAKRNRSVEQQQRDALE